MGEPRQTVYATPRLLDDPLAAADKLCDALQIHRRKDRRAMEQTLVSDKKKGKGFVFVKRKVDPIYAKAAVKLGLPGVGSYEEEKRTYPLKATAAQVLGFAAAWTTRAWPASNCSTTDSSRASPVA